VTDQPEPEDTCRPVEVDGEIISVRGAGEISDEAHQAITALVRAAKAKMAAEPPPVRQQIRAVAFNAVAPALRRHDEWLRLTVRRTVADAVLTAIEEHLAIGDAEAWCKTCRRVWDGPRHRCESDAEQRLYDTQQELLRVQAVADADSKQLEESDANCRRYAEKTTELDAQLTQALTNLDHVLRRARRAEHLRDQYADLAREALYAGQHTGDRIAGWRKRLDQIGGQTAAGTAETDGLYDKLTSMFGGPLPPLGDLPPAVPLPCNHAHLRQPHDPHRWEPQPGMRPVQCPGWAHVPATEATDITKEH
jgi:hypothetical protein